MRKVLELFIHFKNLFMKIIPILLIIFVLVFFMIILWVIPHWQVSLLSGNINDSIAIAELENKFRSTFAQILGGFVIIVGLYFTHRRVTATENNLLLAQEGQITERFTRAIEHLGSDRLELKLGGIYALGRIANESATDHWPIMEILCAYIRKNSSNEDIPYAHYEDSGFYKLSVDIQAALDVLRRRNPAYEYKENGILDLNNTYLLGANLDGINLSNADLFNCNLHGVSLKNAHLHHAFLSNANLWGAYIYNTDLSKADLSDVIFRMAVIDSVNLGEAVIGGVDFEDVIIENTNLDKALKDYPEFVSSLDL